MDPEATGDAGQADPSGPETRVERTGIALVHEGEYILPASGSAARLSGADGGTVVNYHFPIEIEVVGVADEATVAQVVQRVFGELERELSSRP